MILALATIATAAVTLLALSRPSREKMEAELREAEDNTRFYYRVLRRPCLPPALREVANYEYHRALTKVKRLESKLVNK